MINLFLLTLGKLISIFLQIFNLGSGSTWPGHIALKTNKHFVRDLLSNTNCKIILIAGTNGKTTTASLIQSALKEAGKKVIQNTSGANLLNGIASTLLLNTNFFGKLDADYAVFEVDENALPKVLHEIHPAHLVLLNLFRDQLDRYGEVNTIISNWKTALSKLPKETKIILNADDPQIAYLAKSTEATVRYFGLQNSQFGNQKLQHAADSVYCPHCGEKLVFDAVAFSHLGNWHCEKCSFKRPVLEEIPFVIYPLPGLYNKYNVLAAQLVLKHTGLTDQQINDAFTDFEPAFGRQEIVIYKNKQIQLFLSKNPTSFNQSYTTIKELGGKTLLLVLNDRIPDGRDVSWIWDVDLPELSNFKHIIVSGDRVYDMAVRLKYESESQRSSVRQAQDKKVKSQNYDEKIITFENLQDAIDEGIKLIAQDETLFILPTYSAMLETRKIITGKKIL